MVAPGDRIAVMPSVIDLNACKTMTQATLTYGNGLAGTWFGAADDRWPGCPLPSIPVGQDLSAGHT